MDGQGYRPRILIHICTWMDAVLVAMEAGPPNKEQKDDMSFFLALHDPHREVSLVHRALSIFRCACREGGIRRRNPTLDREHKAYLVPLWGDRVRVRTQSSEVGAAAHTTDLAARESSTLLICTQRSYRPATGAGPSISETFQFAPGSRIGVVCR